MDDLQPIGFGRVPIPLGCIRSDHHLTLPDAEMIQWVFPSAIKFQYLAFYGARETLMRKSRLSFQGVGRVPDEQLTFDLVWRAAPTVSELSKRQGFASVRD
jgi:hypothetical protein